MLRWILLLALPVLPALSSTKLLVTVIEQKSGKPLTDLKAGEFSVLDDRTPRQVEDAQFAQGAIDVMLLLDASAIGEAVRPLANDLIQ